MTGNSFGFEYHATGGDLGGGPFGSVGNNIISCNLSTDLWLDSGLGVVNAANNRWDHSPPTRHPPPVTDSGGLDIWVPALTGVTIVGNSVAPTPCP